MHFYKKLSCFAIASVCTFFVFAGNVYANESYKTIDRVNLRTNGSMDAGIIQTLNIGVDVTVTNYDDAGWSQVLYNGQTGFIKSEYIIKAEDYTTSISPAGVELIPWAEAKQVFSTYTPAQVYDVRSGSVYFVQSFSNGNHADVEPLTQQDTNIMYQTFGQRWSWDVRPVWVTINGRTMAASINGMPHGGGVISNNGMNGQICIHFLGSTTHNGNKSFENTHQAGVMEAWNAANK